MDGTTKGKLLNLHARRGEALGQPAVRSPAVCSCLTFSDRPTDGRTDGRVNGSGRGGENGKMRDVSWVGKENSTVVYSVRQSHKHQRRSVRRVFGLGMSVNHF